MERKFINISILLVFVTFYIVGCKEKVEPKIIEVDGTITDVKIADTLFIGKSEKIQVFFEEVCLISYKRHEKIETDSSVAFKLFMNKYSKLNDNVMCAHSIFTGIFTDSIVPTKLGIYKVIVNDTHLIKTVIVK